MYRVRDLRTVKSSVGRERNKNIEANVARPGPWTLRPPFGPLRDRALRALGLALIGDHDKDATRRTLGTLLRRLLAVEPLGDDGDVTRAALEAVCGAVHDASAQGRVLSWCLDEIARAATPQAFRDLTACALVLLGLLETRERSPMSGQHLQACERAVVPVQEAHDAAHCLPRPSALERVLRIAQDVRFSPSVRELAGVAGARNLSDESGLATRTAALAPRRLARYFDRAQVRMGLELGVAASLQTALWLVARAAELDEEAPSAPITPYLSVASDALRDVYLGEDLPQERRERLAAFLSGTWTHPQSGTRHLGPAFDPRDLWAPTPWRLEGVREAAWYFLVRELGALGSTPRAPVAAVLAARVALGALAALEPREDTGAELQWMLRVPPRASEPGSADVHAWLRSVSMTRTADQRDDLAREAHRLLAHARQVPAEHTAPPTKEATVPSAPVEPPKAKARRILVPSQRQYEAWRVYRSPLGQDSPTKAARCLSEQWNEPVHRSWVHRAVERVERYSAASGLAPGTRPPKAGRRQTMDPAKLDQGPRLRGSLLQADSREIEQ